MFNAFSKYIQGNIFFMMIKIYFKNATIIQNAMWVSYLSRYDGSKHYLVPQGKQTRCAECHEKTTSRCSKCDVGVHLKCNLKFHTPK